MSSVNHLYHPHGRQHWQCTLEIFLCYYSKFLPIQGTLLYVQCAQQGCLPLDICRIRCFRGEEDAAHNWQLGKRHCALHSIRLCEKQVEPASAGCPQFHFLYLGSLANWKAAAAQLP